MFKDDEGAKDYTDRWVQADYAVRTLALMMNQGDILRPYIMGDYKNGTGGFVSDNTVNITESKEATLEALEAVMNRMKFTKMTYFQGVEAAVNSLKAREYSGKDCWIIILTDGEFNKPDKIESGEALKEKLMGITAENPKISIAYVPIGNCDIRFEEDRGKRLYTAEGSNILEQVTQVVNLIYARVQLDESTKQSYIQQSDSDGKLYVSMDIPIEKMIVLLQDSEKATEYAAIEDLEEKLRQKIVKESPTATEAFRFGGEISFTGRKTIPEEDEKGKIPGYSTDRIMYSILRGLIYDFRGNGNYSMDMQNEYVSIDVTSDAYEAVDVYYQPAIFVQADYYQDGELVEHGDSCLAASDSSDSEKCIRAGELTVELYMTDSKGNRIANQDSALLYGDSFEVELCAEGGRSVPVQVLDNYRYRFEVEEGNYTLNVRTSWNESYMKNLEIQEPILPLSLELVDGDKIWIDQPEGEGSVFAVRIWEGEEIVPPPSAEKMEITCTIQDTDFCLKPLGYKGNGIWEYRITLADYEQHQIADSIQCYVKAMRPYDSGTAKPVEVFAEESYLLDIVSDPFELSVTAQSDNLSHWVTRLIWGEDIPVTYACDGMELTAKQKEEGLTISDFRIEPYSMQKYFKLDKEGNLHLKGGIYELFSNRYRPGEIGVTMAVAYERYNTVENIVYEHTFLVDYIPGWAKFCVFVLIGGMLLWVLLCIVKRKTKYAIKRAQVNFVLPSGGVPSKVLLRRKWNILIPFCKTAHLVFKEARGIGEPTVRGFDMVIMNDFGGKGWRIVNYGDFARKEYQIDGRAINKDNCTFSRNKAFSVQDRRGRRRVMEIDR